ncbi:DNA-processing protein DprA [Levilactobacillus bambusae]|uniref:DNA-protecting protein DprA n=1 Tax=Levilactobacillus bambusae TaxID=2024736 RepID=A0A2V1N0M2_9LACO|nr:DNA-processing protein DprA [Levilactobacillus bambusae]PWG00821.1 DNA-protecting protein DprA [Levilactobacillus bambusae]
MRQRDFWVRLKLADGIGITGEAKVWRALAPDGQLATDWDQPAEKLAEWAELTGRSKLRFIQSWTGPALEQQAAINLTRNRVCTIDDVNYPQWLREIYAPPVALFYRGDFTLLRQPLLAVVGSRKHSFYALDVLRQLLPDVMAAGVVIVSGLAQGVDTLSHQAALAYQGKTVAVIGTGLDRCYPAGNQALMTELMTNHLVMSEYPLGSRGLPYHYPERDRILAGLCQTVLVVEAAEHSGSLITANSALAENRNVLAVPGAINAPFSAGTNALIAAGAKPVLTSQDILDDLQLG